MTQKPTLAIVIEGGLVQSIVSDHPELIDLEQILVIDYDTEGAHREDLGIVPQADGELCKAYVSSRSIEKATIDLAGVQFSDD